jgi:hypothetical protein
MERRRAAAAVGIITRLVERDAQERRSGPAGDVSVPPRRSEWSHQTYRAAARHSSSAVRGSTYDNQMIAEASARRSARSACEASD